MYTRHMEATYQWVLYRLEHSLPLHSLLSQIWCKLKQGLCHYWCNSNNTAHYCIQEEGLKIQSCHLHCKWSLVLHISWKLLHHPAENVSQLILLLS